MRNIKALYSAAATTALAAAAIFTPSSASGADFTFQYLRTNNGVTISSGTTVHIASSGNGDHYDPNSTSKVGGLTIDQGATLDLTDNLIVIGGGADPAATLTYLRGLIIQGRNVPVGGVGDGRWDGPEITSATAASHKNADGSETRALGYALNSALDSTLGHKTTFGEQTCGLNDILIRYTKNGDADLDGKCGDNDVTVLGGLYDNGTTTGHVWSQGDFNYDGKLDDKDVTILGAFYAETATPISPSELTANYGTEFAAAFEAGQAMAVPEPASLSLLALSAIGLLTRTRRRR